MENIGSPILEGFISVLSLKWVLPVKRRVNPVWHNFNLEASRTQAEFPLCVTVQQPYREVLCIPHVSPESTSQIKSLSDCPQKHVRKWAVRVDPTDIQSQKSVSITAKQPISKDLSKSKTVTHSTSSFEFSNIRIPNRRHFWMCHREHTTSRRRTRSVYINAKHEQDSLVAKEE